MNNEAAVEVPTTPSSLALLNASEIDQQIATAHRFPRSVKHFRDEALAMVTLTESIATECIYALPRDGKVIEGPSARFAEVVASAWRNCRAGARVVNEEDGFVTAQGAFHDLERNVAITYEVRRRIIDKHGRRYKPDMIGVTANAACSIALRNAVLKGIPKALWVDMYAAARKTAAGDFKTLANRRADAMKAFVIYGVKPEQIFTLLNVKGEEDITIDHLVTLKGMLTALQEGETTPDQMFGQTENGIKQPRAKSEVKSAQNDTDKSKAAQTAEPLKDGLINVIKAKLEAAALSPQELFKHLKVQKFEDMNIGHLEEIFAWLKNPS